MMVLQIQKFKTSSSFVTLTPDPIVRIAGQNYIAPVVVPQTHTTLPEKLQAFMNTDVSYSKNVLSAL
jgi:hypothetical protein